MESGELKISHGKSEVDAEELERRKQWDAIAKLYEVEDYSDDLEDAVEQAKNPTPENPEPEASSDDSPDNTSEDPSSPDDIPDPEEPASEPDSEPAMSLEEAKKQEKLAEREAERSDLENKLKKSRERLTELSTKNRRLIPGHKNKIEYVKALSEYETLLDEYLKFEAKAVYDDRMEELSRDLETKLAELNAEDGDLEAKQQALNEAYTENCLKVKEEVNQNFLKNLLKQQNELKDETIKQIDKGNVFRKAVHAFRSNKYIKGALIAAGVAGLAVTGIALAGGLAVGAVSVGFNLTAGGALAGAARGAIAGLISSRQDSKNSAIRDFQSDPEDIKKIIEALGDPTEQDANTKGIANWMTEEYDKAITADRKDNLKRTSIAVGLGAVLGALSSGVQINKTTFTVEKGQIGETPEIIDVTSNLNKVNIAEGHGAYDTFTQMGGDPDKIQQALDIMHSIDSKYGLVPGDNGTVGSFAHTYPGPISSWPDAAQVYIKEVAKEWAKRGLIEPTIIESKPIYGPILKASQSYIYDGFAHYLVGAAAGTVVGDVKTNQTKTITEHSVPIEQPNHIEIDGSPSDAAAAAEIEKQMAEREAALAATEIEKQIAEREAALAATEIESQIADHEVTEREAIGIESQIAEREAAENEVQPVEKEATEIEGKISERLSSQEFASRLREELDRNDVDFLEDDDINLILTPTNATPINTSDIENLANRLSWDSKKALKIFFEQPENRSLMTTQFGEWIIANTPDENPRITAEREQIWQV